MNEPVYDPEYPPVTVIETIRGNVDDKMIAAFMRLHFNVVAALPADKKHFVRPRDRADISRHFMAGHAGVVAMHGRNMVGQLLLTQADGHALKNMRDYPIGGDMSAEDTLTIQTVGLHENFRASAHKLKGGDLAVRLLDAACAEAQAQGRAWVLGKTAQDNTGGQKVFQRAGFQPVGGFEQRGADTYRSIFMAKAIPVAQGRKPAFEMGEPPAFLSRPSRVLSA